MACYAFHWYILEPSIFSCRVIEVTEFQNITILHWIVLQLYCWWYCIENFKGIMSLRRYEDFWKFSSCFRRYGHMCAHVWLPEWPWLCLSVHITHHITQNLYDDLPYNVTTGIFSRTQSPHACFIGIWSIRYVTVNILFYFCEAVTKYRFCTCYL